MPIIPAIKMLIKSEYLRDIIIRWILDEELKDLEVEEDNPIEFTHKSYVVSITWDFVTVVNQKNNKVIDCISSTSEVINFFREGEGIND